MFLLSNPKWHERKIKSFPAALQNKWHAPPPVWIGFHSIVLERWWVKALVHSVCPSYIYWFLSESRLAKKVCENKPHLLMFTLLSCGRSWMGEACYWKPCALYSMTGSAGLLLTDKMSSAPHSPSRSPLSEWIDRWMKPKTDPRLSRGKGSVGLALNWKWTLAIL